MQYWLLDLGNLTIETARIADLAFINWKNIFHAEMAKRDLILHENDFWQAKLLAVITNKTEVVGSHIYNVFDLRTLAVGSHSYLKHFPETEIFEIRQKKIDQIMSMEYLCVNPKCRGKDQGFSWGEVVIGLGFKALQNSDWGAAVGIAREDRKVDKMASQMGARAITHLTMNETPCDIMLMPKAEIKPSANPFAQEKIESLWKTHINHSPYIRTKLLTASKAA